ncbi:MAG: hypothetical protein HWE27_03415 [Gammaproteobacteria bacterium]|nr:hypothetical protein [Gammaproteobacteria bacterium]
MINRTAIAIFLSLSLIQPAFALKLGFLKNSIINELSEADMTSLKTTVNNSLDDLGDRKVLKWTNESKTVEGHLKVLFSYNMGKVTCKRARLYLKSQGKKEPWQMNLCKTEQRWQIMETPLTLLSDSDFKELQLTLASLLDSAPLGEAVFWRAEESSVGGTLAVIKDKKIDEQQCRTALISLKADDNKMLNGQYDFCRKAGADKWSRRATQEN